MMKFEVGFVFLNSETIKILFQTSKNPERIYKKPLSYKVKMLFDVDTLIKRDL